MESSRATKVVVLSIIGGVLGVGYLKFKMIYFWGAYLLKIVLGGVLLLLLFTATSNRKFGDTFSNWLGSISYEAYLSHGMVLSLMSFLLPLDFNSGAYILISAIVTLSLSAGVHAIDKTLVKRLRS